MIKDTPFSISPNPSLLYLTPALRSIIHKVRYAIDHRRGLTCILGDVGMGKSSVVRLIYAEYSVKDDCSVALINNPNFSTDFGLFKAICGEFGLPPRASMYIQEGELKKWLLDQFKADKNVIVLIDESQNLNHKMLERIRSMLNIETDTTKSIQLILSGQIELKDRFNHPKLKALHSRIFAPSTLDPLSVAETRAMIEFRCEREGIDCPVPERLFETIYNLTGGVPREVLKLCDVAYELMRLDGAKQFSETILEDAKGECVV